MEGKKKRAVVFFRIPWVARGILSRLSRLRGFDIFFVEKERVEKVRRLEAAGFRWIKKEYREFSEHLRGMSAAVGHANAIYEATRASSICSTINGLFTKDDSTARRMEVLWKYYFFRGIMDYADQYAAACYLREKAGYGKVTVVCFNSLAYFLERKKDRAISTVVLPGLFVYDGLEKVMPLLKALLARLTNMRKSGGNGSSSDAEMPVSKPFSPENVDVVFFPHQGLFYGDLFKKDHFYSEDPDSPFHCSRMLHVSLNEKNAWWMSESYDYYRENDIPFVDISDLPYRKKDMALSLFRLLISVGPRLFRDLFAFGLWYIAYALFVFAGIKRYCFMLSPFKRLKIALLGYEHLFPRNLAMALAIVGAKVCATQERHVFAFWPDDYYMLDYYFAAGPVAVERGFRNSFIENCIPVGMVREDILFEYAQKQIYDEKYDGIKKNRMLVLALDYHMPENDVEDAARAAAKVSHTRQFYRDLIRLAHETPSIYIVIKGKAAELYKSPFIADIVEEIAGIENMGIELDLKRYNPYFLSEKADLTIACHTSLAEELLAADRKVIFYEATDLMKTLLTYDDIPIIVRDYEGLKEHVENFLRGIYLDEKQRAWLRERFFQDCFHGHVREQVRAVLEQVVSGLPSKTA